MWVYLQRKIDRSPFFVKKAVGRSYDKSIDEVPDSQCDGPSKRPRRGRTNAGLCRGSDRIPSGLFGHSPPPDPNGGGHTQRHNSYPIYLIRPRAVLHPHGLFRRITGPFLKNNTTWQPKKIRWNKYNINKNLIIFFVSIFIQLNGILVSRWLKRMKGSKFRHEYCWHCNANYRKIRRDSHSRHRRRYEHHI